VAEALAHVVRAYHPAAKLPDSESELRGLYLSVLEGQRALLLMDNAANADQVEPLIPPASCLLLVTSRQHFTVPGLSAKNLDTLSAADARDLLLTIAPRIGTQADEIAALCGYLPLALRLAAAAIVKYRNLSPADYVRRLSDRQQRMQLINASLSLTYELLSEELRGHWRWLGVFPDTFWDISAAEVWEVEIDQAKYILGELMAASLVEWNETSDRYRLHDLARLFADAKLSAEERVVGKKRFATHYCDVLAVIQKLYKKGGEPMLRSLLAFDLEWGNIQAGHAWVAAQAETADADVALLGMTYPDAGGYVFDLRQHPRERIRWLEIALLTARRSQDQEFEGATLGNLGLTYFFLGEIHHAIELYEQALSIHRDIGNRGAEGKALINLGLAYADLGETRRAIDFYEQYLDIADEIGDRESEGIALNSLGLAYADLGEIKRAIKFYEQYLDIASEMGDRRGEGNALGNLGIACGDLGETQLAMKFYERQWAIVREIGDRRGEGNALWNMSRALDQLGDRGQAVHHAEQALTIFEQIEAPIAARVRAKLAEWSDQRPHLDPT
jgi:tetratricopeptide (TPR) repeat protein